MNKLFPIFVLLFLFVSACVGGKRKILKEKQMAAVFTDIKKAESLIEMESAIFADSLSRAMLYDAVFKKHHITKSVYDSSLVWYGKNLSKMMRIYDLSYRQLAREKEELGDSLAVEEKKSKRDDSVNIWNDSSSIIFTNDFPLQFCYFNIEPDTPFPSGSIFRLSCRGTILGKLDAPVMIKLFVQQSDTIYMKTDSIFSDKTIDLIVETFATRQIIRVYGYFYKKNEPEKETYRFIYFDQIQLVRYNYGSFKRKNLQEVSDLR